MAAQKPVGFVPDGFVPDAPTQPSGDVPEGFVPETTPSPSTTPLPFGVHGLAPGLDLATGIAKGLGQTVTNLGELIHKVPGVSTAIDALYGTPGLSKTAFAQAQHALAPTTPLQTVGKVGEQIAEVVAPSRAITAAGTKAVTTLTPRLAPLIGETAAKVLPRAAVEAASGGGMALAQGGDPRVGAALGAVGPMIGAGVEAAAPGLKTAAEKKVVQALGPTKERFKAIAERLAPNILQRGLGGSREALQAQAASTLETVGDQLDTALQQYGSQTLSTQPILNALETAKDAFRTTVQRPTGPATVVFEPRSLRQLEGLQSIITDLGPDARVDQLVAVRRAWDRVVDQAGGYAQRAGGAIGIPLKEQSEAWAKREGAGAIRQLLNDEVPDLAAINKEWGFWKNLDDVLTQTLKRTQPQGPGVGRLLAESAGGVAGTMLGAPAGVVPALSTGYALGKVLSLAKGAVTSPRWRLVDAGLRDQLADAIMNNQVGGLMKTLGRISAVEGAKLSPGVAAP